MALDTKQWLKDLGVADDQIDTVAAALSPHSGKIEEGFLRQSDYSRRSSELQTKQTALDTANERLNAEMVEWAQTRDAGGEITNKMRTDMAAAQGEVTRLTTIIKSKASELGLDPATLGLAEPPVHVDPPVRQTNDPDPRYVDRAQFGAAADLLLTLPAELQQIAQEHFALTGEHIDVRPMVAEFKARASATRQDPNKPVDIRQIWESTYQIPAKRDAAAATVRAAETAAAEQRGYERARTEATVPGASPVGHHSPVLRNRPADGPKLQRPSVAGKVDTVSRAASALATHKYANYRGDRTNPAPAGGGGAGT